MTYFTDTVINLLKNDIKESSIKRYISWLKMVSPKKWDVNNVNDVLNTNNKIKEHKAYTSILAAILKILKITGKTELYNEYNNIYKNIDKKRDFKVASEDDKKNYISPVDIIKLRDTYDKDYKNKDLEYNLKRLVLYLITEIAPLRSQDFITVAYSKKDSVNYIDIKNKKLIITEGKTTGVNNIRNININNTVIKVIKFFKKTYKSKWLIPQLKHTNEHMTSSAYAQLLNKIFNANISTNRLRNIYISYWTDSGMSAKEKKEKADIMGHCITTAYTVYNKYSTDLHDETVKKLMDKIKFLEQRLAAFKKED